MAARACRLAPYRALRGARLGVLGSLGKCLRCAGSFPVHRGSWAEAPSVRAPDETKPEATLARSSREREVAAACAALSESVKAGDTAWFERVIIQLRSILLERQSEDAVTQAEAGGTPFPTRALPTKPPPATPITSELQRAEPEPPWLEALRLLEEAARPQPNPSPKLLAAGHFPARVPAPPAASGEEKLKAYLDSFATMQASEEEDPAWARAIRILESVPVSQGQRRQEPPQQPSRAPQPLPTAGSSRSATGRDSGDPGQPIRLQSYQRLLMDGAALPAEPGASLPLRFSGHAQVSAPTAPRREDGPLPSPGRAPEAARAASAGGPGPKQSAKGPSPAAAPRGEAVGTGRGHLVSALPSAAGEMEEAELRKEDFVWSEHEFNDGEKENRRVLREFTKEFKRMAEATPDGVRDPKLLTAALDLALACVKCYELDKADAIYRRVLGECRRRGMPWDVKCLQDLATLRCKQHRQADAAELLEELAAKAPPHPATFINLGTVYNQLRQYDRAETWFQQAVNLKGGAPDKEDIWNLAICKKNMGRYDEALPMLQQALSAFQEQEPDQPVTIAKLHSSLGGCLHDMGRHSEAAEEYQKAHGLYAATVGRSSPLFCGAAEGLAKALLKERQHDRAFQALREAFEVHARCDSVHPTPLFECLEMAMDIHDQYPGVDLVSLRSPIEDAMRNLESRGQDKDGNAGLVMSRAGKLLLRAGGAREEAYALQLLRRGRPLIQEAHDAEEANLAHELLEVDLLVQKSTSSAAEKPELQGSGLAL